MGNPRSGVGGCPGPQGRIGLVLIGLRGWTLLEPWGAGADRLGGAGLVPEGHAGDPDPEALGALFEGASFAQVFRALGRPAVSPGVLALVPQYAEGLSGRPRTRCGPA